jgi:hypothetical protein
MRYKVIWIDDQCDEQKPFITFAEQMEIDITPFKFATEGLDELESNWGKYQGVILDAKGLKETINEVPKLDSLSYSMARLEQLKSKGYIPYFIFTGQPDLLNADLFQQMLNGKTPYYKDTDHERLFADIKSEINNLPDTQIYYKYKDIFEVFDLGYLDSKIRSQLIMAINNVDLTSNPDIKSNLVLIRGIQEEIFNKLRAVGIVPQNMTNFNGANKHLAGNVDPKNNYNPTTQVYQNSSITELNKLLYWVSGEYIHNVADQTYYISHYTVKSLLFNLFELLLWFKATMKQYSK